MYMSTKLTDREVEIRSKDLDNNRVLSALTRRSVILKDFIREQTSTQQEISIA